MRSQMGAPWCPNARLVERNLHKIRHVGPVFCKALMVLTELQTNKTVRRIAHPDSSVGTLTLTLSKMLGLRE